MAEPTFLSPSLEDAQLLKTNRVATTAIHALMSEKGMTFISLKMLFGRLKRAGAAENRAQRQSFSYICT